MTHANIKGGIVAVRANAGNSSQILAEMSSAFGQFKQDHKAEVRQLGAAIDDVNQTLAGLRVGSGAGTASGGVSQRDRTEVNAALRKLIRDGDAAPLAALQSGINAGMSTDSNPDGGYSVVPFLSPALQERLIATSPMRQLARIEQIATDTFEEITSLGLSGGAWVSETEARGDTATPQLHKLSVPVAEVMAQPKVTQKLLDDSAFDLAGWLATNISRSFASLEGAAFISGDGIGKPKGLLSYPTDDAADDARPWATIQTIPTGKADGFIAPTTTASPADSLLDLVYSLKPEYRAGASFIMNRKTASVVRKMKDADGRFLWSESLAAGEPPRLLGFPVYLDEEMPDVAADARPIAFGDFMAGYLIVDRIGLRLLRDPFTDKPNVRFYTTKRVGGAVFNSEAIKLLRVGI
jgi:HK97 family phage major capsid protein